MVRAVCLGLACLAMLPNVHAGAINDFVEAHRIYTPKPVTPGMMRFSTTYMRDNDMFELNEFNFYDSYIEHVRLFAVDSIALQQYKSRGEECSRGERTKISAKALSVCGRFVAALYVDSHNVSPAFFGFKRASIEVVPKFKDGVFYFVKDGSNVLLNQAGNFGIKKNKRYLIEINLSPYGDYDQREIDLPFDYEAYVSSAQLIR